MEPPEYGKTFKLGTVSSTSRGEPDPKQVFLVEIKGHLLEDKKLTMGLSADGVMNKIDVSSTNHTGEFISQALKSAGTIASKFLVAGLSVETPPAAAPADIATARATCKDLLPNETDLYTSLNSTDKVFYCSLSHRERMVYGSMNAYLRTSFREYVSARKIPACMSLSPEDQATFDFKGHFLQALSVYNEIVELRHQLGTIAGASGLASNVTPDYLKLLASRIEDPLQADLNQFFGQEVQNVERHL